MLDRLEFILSEALISLRRNTWMTFASVTTSAMALFLLGGIGMIYISLANYAAGLEKSFEMRVLMKDNPTPDDISSLQKKLEAMPEVSSVTFKSKAEVWKTFKEQNPGVVQDVAQDLDNPLPDTYILNLKDLKEAPKIAKVIEKFPEVATKNGVNWLPDVQKFLEQTMGTLRWLGIVLGGLMIATGGILIYNTIRLTMLARRREIRIMELVGATKAMVITPLLLEGATQGFFGALLASLVLMVGYGVVVKTLEVFNPLHNPDPFPFTSVILILGAIGILYGLLCSSIAIREPKQKEVPR